MFDPYAHIPRINKGMIYLGACLIAGIRLAREKCVIIVRFPHPTRSMNPWISRMRFTIVCFERYRNG